MDILKAEIARKRKLLEENQLVDESKKCFKRADLARKEKEEYFKRCGYKMDKTEENEPSTSANPVLELELTEEKLPMTLSRQEVIRRSRERGEPIRLFGESDYDAFQRLRKIEILTPEVNKGLRNDSKAAMDKIDQQYSNEIVGGTESGDPDTQHDSKVHEENTTIEELEALGKTLGTGDDSGDQDVIAKFLKFLSGVWAKDLNSREDHVKRSVQGKVASATHSQTESYLEPLFKKLRKKSLPPDIKESITDIIKFMLEREYVQANDAYLQMAIGNAPWPIGVTMVGIHARTGREKIFSKHVAHVLNDETQRKYIQFTEEYSQRIPHNDWPRVIVVADGSCGESCSVLGISSDYIVESCHAYGANATIERLDQRQVPTPEIRAHNLYFDSSAYGMDALREHKNPTAKSGFHSKIYGTFRNRYMALACPTSDTKMVRFLRHTANSSIMKNIFHESFNAYKTDIEPRLNDVMLHHMQCSRRLFEIQLSHRRISAAYIEGENVAVIVEGEAARVLNFDTGFGVNLGMRGLESVGTFIYRIATAVDQHDILEASSAKMQFSKQVAEMFKQTGSAESIYE